MLLLDAKKPRTSQLAYWLGSWQWRDDGWNGPLQSRSALDLRSVPQAESSKHLGGFGLFAMPEDVSPGSEYDRVDGDWHSQASRRWASALNVGRADSLIAALWRTLTIDSDPSGDDGPKPLMPTVEGRLNLRLGGRLPVHSERFVWGQHSHTAKVKDLLRRDFARTADDAIHGKLKDREHHRRVLDWLCHKYRIDDWREFVPSSLQKDIPGRLKHETSYSDDFNRASLGAGWTEVRGGYAIVSSTQLITVANSTTARLCRYESDVSGDDHEAEIDYVQQATNNAWMGPTVRCASSGNTCYYAVSRTTSSLAGIYKWVGSSQSAISTNSSGSGPTVNVRLRANGSDLTLYLDDVAVITTTDTSNTGQLRGGVNSHPSDDSRGDNWFFTDLAVATPLPVFVHHYRQQGFM